MYHSLRKRLDDETLLHLSVELEMTDKEIGKLYGVHRSTISHLRRRCNVPTRRKLGREGELFILDKLKAFGFDAVDMNEVDKLAGFDILVDNQIRIEVKTSRANRKDGAYRFSLSEQLTNGNKVGENRISLKDGRTRKLYRNSCDILIFVCWDSKSVFIIKSGDIPDTQSCVGISEESKRYKANKNNWEVLKELTPISV